MYGRIPVTFAEYPAKPQGMSTMKDNYSINSIQRRRKRINSIICY